MPLMQDQKEKSGSFRLRRVIVVALFFMMVGTAMELYLLDHYEDVLQLIPLLCIGTALVMVVILLFQRTSMKKVIFPETAQADPAGCSRNPGKPYAAQGIGAYLLYPAGHRTGHRHGLCHSQRIRL